MTPIAICADDYALHTRIDAGMIALAKQGRLSAVSCMTDSPRWRDAAQALAPLRDACDVGLHLNLTEGFGAAADSLGATMVRAWTRQYDRSWLRRRLEAQFDAFEQALGRPDFIDGHQHIHQFPVIRATLLEILPRRYGGQPSAMPWVRNTIPASSNFGRRPAWLERLGGRALLDALTRRGIPTNAGFAGSYGFDATSADAYGARVSLWLAAARPGMLLMCHPALQMVDGDPIGTQRALEYAYLASPEFMRLLQARRIEVVRMSTWLPRSR